MMKIALSDWQAFLNGLQDWYSPDKRQLPWKDLDDAYLVWVSEVFLQQTQADRVIEFWLRFTAKFPRVEDLAEASFAEALPYFKGLGFYGRLRRMLLTAQAVCENKKYFNTSRNRYEFPRELNELEKLPGVGPYTARAIASFAYGKKVLAPDTNVVRIISRFFGVDREFETPKDLKDFKAKMTKWVMKNLDFFDDHYPDDFSLNQVLMDFGASVCSARKPKCDECPLRLKCSYVKNSQHFEKTFVTKRSAKPRSLRGFRKIVIGVLIQNKQVLVSRRKADQSFAGLLEFPGGKVEKGEDLRTALQREFREEVGVEVSVRPYFEKLVVEERRIVLHFHRCRVLTGTPLAQEGQELMWIDQGDLNPEEFIPANAEIIQALKTSRL